MARVSMKLNCNEKVTEVNVLVLLQRKIYYIVDSLLEIGSLSKWKRPWNSPPAIVWKKDESVRMCWLLTDIYTSSMSNINQLLDCLADVIYYSSIHSGHTYYQVELVENPGQNRAIFLHWIPFLSLYDIATFQKVIHELHSGLMFQGIVMHLNSILINLKWWRSSMEGWRQYLRGYKNRNSE